MVVQNYTPFPRHPKFLATMKKKIKKIIHKVCAYVNTRAYKTVIYVKWSPKCQKFEKFQKAVKCIG